MPTIEDMENIHGWIPGSEKPEEMPNDKLILWWQNYWLPAIAGDKNYGNDNKHYKLPSQNHNFIVGNKPKTGPCVTIVTEAFGILLFMNCHGKWQAMHALKKQYGTDAKIPKGKLAEIEFKAIFSDQSDGQVQGGGWAPEAVVELNKQIQRIRAVRLEDGANKWEKHRYALNLLRAQKGITETTVAATLKMKRKKGW